MIPVRNAVILAAGPATRFVPLSLEQPKGLFEVGGERLIERQIRQLLQAGISDITLVLGYKREMFLYLQEKFGVRCLYNPLYEEKNNIESLLLARDRIADTYICSCDDYFVQNPFRQQEEHAFYAGYRVDGPSQEMFVRTDADGRILKMEKGLDGGAILLGHSFWTKEFAEAFFRIADCDRCVGRYEKAYWEWLVRDQLALLPPFYFKEYPAGRIFEFDYFEELRDFDEAYRADAHSRIIRNICMVMHCKDMDVKCFRAVHEGLTNRSFVFRVGETDYIYRHPGDGTEYIISRRNERQSLEYARALGLDPTYLYMDVEEGWKISRYVPAFREPDYADEADWAKVLPVLRRLHRSDVHPGYGMRPWEDALAMEALLRTKNPACFAPYEDLKARVGALYESTLGDGVQKCFCHGDTYAHNWMITPAGEVILIDWEYAGWSDPGIDVGYYIVDAQYDLPTARRFIAAYLEGAVTPVLERHYLSYTALIAYYWFVWALYRTSCGAHMDDSLTAWREMAERYACPR